MFKYEECKIEKQIEITSIVSAFEYDYSDTYSYKGETHNFWEFNLVKKGKVNITVDDKVYQLDSNKLILLKPNEFHNVSSCGEPFSLLIFSFNVKSPINAENIIFSLDIEDKSYIKKLLDLANKIFIFDKHTVKSFKKDYLSELQIFINKLEIFLLKLFQEKSNLNCQIENITTINFAKLIEILKNNLSKNLTINDIATLAQMSPSNVKKTFSLFVKEGIISYFNQIKIQEAKILLLQGLSVGNIATALGFLEQNYFSNVFKKATGYSPKSWLKAQQK